MTYRIPAGKDTDASLEQQEEEFLVQNNKLCKICAHDFGRWACPACGAWRWIACLTRKPEHSVGIISPILPLLPTDSGYKAKLPEKPGKSVKWISINDIILLRKCPRCQHSWYVKSRKK